MIDEQLVPRGIADPGVLAAFMKVERHRFVPSTRGGEAYSDTPLAIGRGQTISQPYIVALMTQYLGLSGKEKVLEIGTGSGYQAAILANLCKKVFTVERDGPLLERAQEILASQGYLNIDFRCADGTLGWPEESPFDAVIVTAGAPYVPEALKKQLTDGGRLVIPVGAYRFQRLQRIRREGDSFISEDICGCVFVPLVGEDGWGE